MQRRSARAWLALSPVLAAMFVASCSEEQAAGPRIASLVLISGNGQAAAIGSLLPVPLVVRAEDQRESPIPNAVIEFAVTSGGGIVSPRTDTTDANGRAEATFRLGSGVGVHTVSATLRGLPPVSFTANATAAPASKLTTSDGDGQTAKVTTQLAKELAVKVTDAFDNVKAGVSVSFTVTAGGGAVSAASVLSDASGIAKVKWTLGTVAGAQTVIAGTGTLTPVTFNATATPDNPAILTRVSGENQSGAPGAALADSLVVRLTDQYGNGIAGTTITWAAAIGNGTVSPSTSVTSSTGRAAARWVLGPTGGPKTATASSTSFNVTFNAGGTVSYTAVNAGSRHGCGLGAGGVAYCWGYNGDGQLGIGQAPSGSGPVFAFPQPTSATGNLTFSQVSGGRFHSCAITLAGIAYCWGNNIDGRLGNGSTTTSNAPAAVSGTTTFGAIAAGRLHSCGLDLSARAWCWGSNANGQVGFVGGGVIPADSLLVNVPALVRTGLTFTAISTGGLHTCAIATGGAAFCWGANVSGQVGDGTNVLAIRPVAVTTAFLFTAISAGFSHSCAIRTTGAAYCWGLNTDGQLGDGTNLSSNLPVAVGAALTFTAISSGQSHTCGVTTGGAAFCWGQNDKGQLGDGTTAATNAPVAVLGGLAFTVISAGDAQSCGVTTTNVLYCWGDNEYGQLGDGTTVNRLVPARVAFQP